MGKPANRFLTADRLLHSFPDKTPGVVMRTLLAGAFLLLAAPATLSAQEIFGVSPGMDFEEAAAKLETRARSSRSAEKDGVYTSTFETGQGLITIAASMDAFESRSEARVQWISRSITADRYSRDTAQQVCSRYRKRWERSLGEAHEDNLESGTSWRWEKPTLQARILCYRSEKTTSTELVLMNEPVLLSSTPDRFTALDHHKSVLTRRLAHA